MLSNDMRGLIREFGRTATLRKVTAGSYSPSTGTVSSTTTDYSVKAYMAEYKLTELTVDNIVRGDRRAVMSAYDTSGATLPSPDEGDLFVGIGDTVRVVSVQTLYSGDNIVCYICQVRE